MKPDTEIEQKRALCKGLTRTGKDRAILLCLAEGLLEAVSIIIDRF